MTKAAWTPKFQAIDASGNPYAGGKLYTYAGGTTTPLATYSDQTGGTPNANPVVLDSAGRADVWLTNQTLYKLVLKDSSDSTIWTVDNFSVIDGVSIAASQTIATLSVGSGGLSVTSTGTLSVAGGATSLQSLSATTLAVSGGATFDTTTLAVDATNDRVGIGTVSPAVKVHVVGSANTELQRWDDGTRAVNIGASGGVPYIGTGTNDPLAIRANSTTVATFNNGTMTLPINGAIEVSSGSLFSQSVYNNTTATSADVTVSGVAGAIRRSTSSLRYKFAVETVKPERSEFLHQLRPIWYRSSCDGDRKDWSYYGFAAEEVAKLEPRIVHWEQDPDKAEGELRPSGLMYDRITVFLVMEIQKLKARLDAAGVK